MSVDHSEVELVDGTVATKIAYTAAVAALMAVFSWTSVPYPLSAAPVSLQTLGVFLAGIFLGPLWGAGAMTLYVIVGVLGVPVFAGGQAGMAHLVSPTGGFLLSFPVAAAAIGIVVHRGLVIRDPEDVSLRWYLLGVTASLVVTYAIGAPWMGMTLELSAQETLVTGVLVFIPVSAAEAFAAIVAARSGRVRPP